MRHLVSVALVVLSAVPAFADDWVPPTRTTAKSSSGSFQATADPDTSKLTVAQNGKQVFETAYVAMPVAMLVSDQGQVVTLDQWYGGGPAMVIYDATGKVVVDLRLEELLTTDDLAHQDTQRGWRDTSKAAKLDGDAVVVPTAWGSEVRVRLDGTDLAIPTDQDRFASYLDGTRKYDALVVMASYNPDRDGEIRCVVEKTRSECVSPRRIKKHRYKKSAYARMLAAAKAFAPYLGNDRPDGDYWAVGFSFTERGATYGYGASLPAKLSTSDADLTAAFRKLKQLTGLK